MNKFMDEQEARIRVSLCGNVVGLVDIEQLEAIGKFGIKNENLKIDMLLMYGSICMS